MTKFAELDAEVRTIRPALVRFVGRLAGDTDAEDVVQVTLSKAARMLSNFRGDGTLRAWIFRIARNTAVDHLRARGTVGREFSEESGTDTGERVDPTQERRLERQQMSGCVDEVLRLLPLHYQEVLAVSDMKALSEKETAAILGISTGAAKIRLHRARTQLKKELEKACSFYRDTDNVLCCDPKQDFKKSAYPSEPNARLQGKRRKTVGDANSKKEDFTMKKDTGLSAKQKHLIGAGAAVAAGCRPCTVSFVAGAKADGACDRGVRLTIERGLESRARATNEMISFADKMFERPDIDETFRANRAPLDALISVAAAVASNTASIVASTIKSARDTGATDEQIHMAVQIGRTARRGAENATETTVAAALGASPSKKCCETPNPEDGDFDTPSLSAPPNETDDNRSDSCNCGGPSK